MSDDDRDGALAETLADESGGDPAVSVAAADTVATAPVDGRAETVAATPVEGAAETVAATPSGVGAGAGRSTGSRVPRQVAVGAGELDDEGERYRIGKALGRGGMGEVTVADDVRIGREVAIKTLREEVRTDGGSWVRFLREARVQGQLEHPAIVPVYDLGTGPDGEPYFTMKRLRGLTLEEVLAALAGGDAEVERTHSPRKLLTGFAQVCQAVHFAHTRGVVHRDLKPSNIMLGSFGEVYVLDWGVARLHGTGDESVPAVSGEGGTGGARGSGAAQTSHGAVIGTPGYMAPEQLRGELDRIDARTDVYGLGAILFEILTLTPLHDRSSNQSIVRSTLAGADARATVRAADRDVAPELEAVCVRATATEPDQRYADVAALVADVERYLDGDRDLARRRELAVEHAEAAAADAERARAGDHEARKRALREAGRALALDPGNQQAADAMTRLFVEPPAVVPDEVEATLRELSRATHQREALIGGAIYGAQLLFLPILVWMGVRRWDYLIAIAAIITTLGVHATVLGLRGLESRGHMVVAVLLNSLGLALLSRLLGPFVLLPGLVSLSAMSFSFQHEHINLHFNVAAGLAAIGVPWLLEALGVWGTTYQFTGDAMIIRSEMVRTPALPTLVALAGVSVGMVVSAALFVRQMMRLKAASERHLHLQTWQLRQLMPDHARGAVAVLPDASPATCAPGC